MKLTREQAIGIVLELEDIYDGVTNPGEPSLMDILNALGVSLAEVEKVRDSLDEARDSLDDGA